MFVGEQADPHDHSVKSSGGATNTSKPQHQSRVPSISRSSTVREQDERVELDQRVSQEVC